jgi:hypothetical protein
MQYLNKLLEFFIETPKGEEFELLKGCKVDSSKGVYSLEKERFEYELTEDKPIL